MTTDETCQVCAAEEAALTAALTGDTTLPVAARDTTWDGQAALDRVFEFYTDGDTVDTEGIARAFLWRDDADPALRGSYRLGFADIIDGQLRIVPAGVAATAGGRGVDATDLPEDDKARVRSRICTLYGTVRDEFDDWPECPFVETETASATVVAAAAPELPPAAWFEDPGFRMPTPLTITNEGRVMGHIAVWGTCHTGYAGRCVTPPVSASGYAYFRTGELLTDGGPVAVGHLTVDTGHAPGDMSAIPAMSHYDNTGATAAYVAAGEDEHGVWFSGTLKPDATEEQVRALRASPLSGDWRPIGRGLELVAALGVNVPGFPVPRAVVAAGKTTAILAAGVLPVASPTDPVSPDDLVLLRARTIRATMN